MTAALLPASRYRIALFTVSRPARLADAISLMAAGAVPMAGGTDLVDRMKLGQRYPRVVSLQAIPELRSIVREDGTLCIGAAVTHRMASEHSLLREALPSLAAFFAILGNPRIRDRGTLGGNVMANEPGYEVAATLAALDASAEFLRQDGVRYAVPVLQAAASKDLLVQFRVPDIDDVKFSWDRSHRDTLTLLAGERRSRRRVVVLPAAGRAVMATDEDVLLRRIPAFSRHASQVAAVLLRRLQ